jgi:hypothetical protein
MLTKCLYISFSWKILDDIFECMKLGSPVTELSTVCFLKSLSRDSGSNMYTRSRWSVKIVTGLSLIRKCLSLSVASTIGYASFSITFHRFLGSLEVSTEECQRLMPLLIWSFLQIFWKYLCQNQTTVWIRCACKEAKLSVIFWMCQSESISKDFFQTLKTFTVLFRPISLKRYCTKL